MGGKRLGYTYSVNQRAKDLRAPEFTDFDYIVRIVFANIDRYYNGVCDGLLLAKRIAKHSEGKKYGKWLPTTS